MSLGIHVQFRYAYQQDGPALQVVRCLVDMIMYNIIKDKPKANFLLGSQILLIDLIKRDFKEVVIMSPFRIRSVNNELFDTVFFVTLTGLDHSKS